MQNGVKLASNKMCNNKTFHKNITSKQKMKKTMGSLFEGTRMTVAKRQKYLMLFASVGQYNPHIH